MPTDVPFNEVRKAIFEAEAAVIVLIEKWADDKAIPEEEAQDAIAEILGPLQELLKNRGDLNY